MGFFVEIKRKFHRLKQDKKMIKILQMYVYEKNNKYDLRENPPGTQGRNGEQVFLPRSLAFWNSNVKSGYQKRLP